MTLSQTISDFSGLFGTKESQNFQTVTDCSGHSKYNEYYVNGEMIIRIHKTKIIWLIFKYPSFEHTFMNFRFVQLS